MTKKLLHLTACFASSGLARIGLERMGEMLGWGRLRVYALMCCSLKQLLLQHSLLSGMNESGNSLVASPLFWMSRY